MIFFDLFSVEKNTPAATVDGSIPPRTKLTRRAIPAGPSWHNGRRAPP
jgi:hypothetical protein